MRHNMLSLEQRQRRKKLLTTSIFILCCSTSVFAFLANQMQNINEVTTHWNGDNLVVQDTNMRAIFTHLSYWSDHGETIAALPTPQPIVDNIEKIFTQEDLKKLKWLDRYGNSLPPPPPDKEVSAIYYTGIGTGYARAKLY